MAEKKKLVILEDGLLATLAANPAATRELPFLLPLAAGAAKKVGCGRCGRKAAAGAAKFLAAKAAIAGMDAGRKLRLKELLNAHQVRVTYSTPANDPKNPAKRRTVVLTF